MAFIPVNLDETVEQKPVPKGNYELQITGAKLQETGENSKHPGAPMIRVNLAFEDLELNAPGITHFITLPYEGDDNANFKLLMLKRFLVAFKIPYSNEGIDPEALVVDMVGNTTKLDVQLTEPNDNGDIYNRIQIPRLRDEPVAAAGGRRKRAWLIDHGIVLPTLRNGGGFFYSSLGELWKSYIISFGFP